MLEKLLLHLVASQMTQAVMAQVTSPTDPMQRQILACQCEVNFYEWLRVNLSDPAWPTPVINPAWLTAAIAAALVPTPPTTTAPAAGATVAPTLAAITPAPVAAKMKADPHFQRLLKICPSNPSGT